jgi:hypothetical protein
MRSHYFIERTGVEARQLANRSGVLLLDGVVVAEIAFAETPGALISVWAKSRPIALRAAGLIIFQPICIREPRLVRCGGRGEVW